MSETKEVKKETKKVEKKETLVTVEHFKEHIKDTGLKVVPLKGTNAVKFDKNICYIRNATYGISVWVAIGKDANKTKQIKTTEELCSFVENLKKYIEKVKENK